MSNTLTDAYVYKKQLDKTNTMLALLLDNINFAKNMCSPTDYVGALLTRNQLLTAHDVLVESRRLLLSK